MTASPPLRLPSRLSDAHKGDFGRVLLVGGSRGMSGSVALSSIAALRCGSGLVSAYVPDRCLETVAGFHPAIMTIPGPDDPQGRFDISAASQLGQHIEKSSAIGCGPGMTTEPGSMAIVERLLQATTTPRVLDADAINTLAIMNWTNDDDPSFDLGPLILTPHPGEFHRLANVSASDRPGQIDAASKLSDRSGAIIVLKGGPTVVVDGQDKWTNTTGNPGMATAGSGDVLTGVITSLLGQGLPAADAARLGVWIHGYAGDAAAERTGQASMTAQEILDALPQGILAAS
ncbi:MAG: NAD(P)H-hydrate dehydratase [Pirellulaceae bacterium]|nr:NAD(P)H-hydrate dehydratase [Pirellulaceae bacterium]